MIRLGHKRVGEQATGLLAPEERSPEFDMQDDIGGIEGDKQRALVREDGRHAMGETKTRRGRRQVNLTPAR